MGRFFGDTNAPPAAFSAQGAPIVPGVQPLPPSAANPTKGVPNSQPGSFWLGAGRPVTWRADATYGPWATWGSPIFDLRAELHGAFSERPQAQPIRPWQSQRLYVQIDGWTEGLSAALTLRVFAAEWGSIDNSEDVDQISKVEDITSSLYSGQVDPQGPQPPWSTGAVTRAIGIWEPPPSRLRYWQVKLFFNWPDITIPVTTPRVVVRGAMY